MMLRPAIQAFCADGTVCIPGRGGVLHLSRGFRLRAPETRAAANRVRNQVDACLTQLPTLLAENDRFMLQWKTTSDFGDLLPAYARDTPKDAPPAVQRYRNRKAIHFLEAINAGRLRREEVTLWLGQDLPHPRPSREDREDPALFYGGLLAERAAELAKLAAPMQAVLAPAGMTLEPLDKQAVLSAWHRHLNASAASRRATITVPPDATFSLTDLCFLSELRGLGDRGFILDGEYHKCRVLQRMPGITYPGLLDPFTTLPISDFTLTVLVQRLSRAWLLGRLQARLEKIQRQLQRRHDPLLAVSRAQIEEKLAQLARGAIVPLEVKFIIVLHAPTPDELRRQDDLAKGATARLHGAQFFDASLAATSRNLFLMTLPGRLHSDDPCYAVYAESDAAASLLPISSSFEAHLAGAEALFEGPYANLIGVRLAVGEGLASTQQHCFVSGTNGSGKSYFLCRLETETAPFFQQTYILDYGNSHRAHVEATGGTSLVITPDCPWTFNAFESKVPLSASHRALIAALAMQQIGVSKDEDKAGEHHALLSHHVAEVCTDFADAWLRRQPEAERLRLARHALVLHQLSAERMGEPLEAFTTLRDEQVANPEGARQRLAAPSEAAVRAFYTQHRDAVQELAYAYLPEYPTLSSLREHLAVAGMQDERCRRLADRLRPWCRGGSYGTLFSGQSNVQLAGHRVLHLELGRLDNSAKALQAALWFLLLIVIRQNLLTRPAQERKRVVLEEISRLLEVPGAEAIIREMFSTFRKYNVQCTLVCQQLAQLESATLRSVVLGNVRMAFLFHPGTATDLDLTSQHLPLSEAAKAMILKYARPDQLRDPVYSECCYLHLTSGEPYVGTIRLMPLPDDEQHQS